MRLLVTLTTRVLAPAFFVLALVLALGGAPAALEASECIQKDEKLCKSNESCVKFDLIVWEYNQCTTTNQYGTLAQYCKYCHN